MLTVGLLLLGVLLGAFGTLIGAGGGFLLAPLLVFLYPHEAPAVLTSISLTVVFCNAASGTLAYARMRRIDVRSGVWFALATIPGAVLGALTTRRLDHRVFDPILGAALLLGSGLLFFVGETGPGGAAEKRSLPLGVGLSVLVGYLSSLLGIGGGILHVPILVHMLGFPVHVATATSHFVLAVMSLAGVLTHVAMGGYLQALDRALPLGIGALIGAQLGARLSTRIHGDWILRSLAIALAAVGLRLVLVAFLRH